MNKNKVLISSVSIQKKSKPNLKNEKSKSNKRESTSTKGCHPICLFYNPNFKNWFKQFAEVMKDTIETEEQPVLILPKIKKEYRHHLWILHHHAYNVSRMYPGNHLNLIKDYFVYQTEPLFFFKKGRPYQEFLFKAIQIWEYSWNNILYMHEWFVENGIEIQDSHTTGGFRKVKMSEKMFKKKVRYVPWGYSSYQERKYMQHLELDESKFYDDRFTSNCEENNEKDIDILFYGSLDGERNRRRDIVKAIKRHNPDYNFYIPEKGAYDAGLDKLIHRSRIVLSLSTFGSKETNQDPRVIPLICKKAFVINETINDPVHQKIFDDLIITGEADELPQLCHYYLSHRQGIELRERYVNQSYQWIINNYSLRNFLPMEYIYHIAKRKSQILKNDLHI